MSRHQASPSELKARLEAERSGAPFLLYFDDAGAQRIHPLDVAAEQIVIGRGIAEIQIDWDQEVSRVHAQLERVGSDWALADDGLSRNGSFVNGERLDGHRRLADGDQLRVGSTVLVFRWPGGGVGAATQASDRPQAAVGVSEAQRRVLVALCRPYGNADGFAAPASNKQIAAELFISVAAVKTHLRALCQKFGIEHLPQNQKRLRLVELAFQFGKVTKRDLGA